MQFVSQADRWTDRGETRYRNKHRYRQASTYRKVDRSRQSSRQIQIGKHTDKNKQTQTDKQTDTDRQAHRYWESICVHTHTHKDRWTVTVSHPYRQTERQRDRQSGRQRHAGGQTCKRANTEKIRQADTKTTRQTDTKTGRHILVKDSETQPKRQPQSVGRPDKLLLPPTFTVSLVRRAVTTPAITPIRRPPRHMTKNLTMPRIIWSAVMSSTVMNVSITLYSITVTPSETHKTAPTLIPSHQPDLNHTTHSISCDPTTSTLLKSHNTQYLLWFHEIHLTQIT